MTSEVILLEKKWRFYNVAVDRYNKIVGFCILMINLGKFKLVTAFLKLKTVK